MVNVASKNIYWKYDKQTATTHSNWHNEIGRSATFHRFHEYRSLMRTIYILPISTHSSNHGFIYLSLSPLFISLSFTLALLDRAVRRLLLFYNYLRLDVLCESIFISGNFSGISVDWTINRCGRIGRKSRAMILIVFGYIKVNKFLVRN